MMQVATMACVGFCFVWVTGLSAQKSVPCVQTSPAHTGFEVPQEPEADPDTGGEPSWWSLAFQERKWDLALAMLENTQSSERPPAAAILMDYLRQEGTLILDPGYEAVHFSELRHHFPEFEQLQSALNWADWYLRVAPQRVGDIDLEVLQATSSYIESVCPDPETPYWKGFTRAAIAIEEALEQGESNPLAALTSSQPRRWVELEKNIPSRLGAGHVWVAPKAHYRVSKGIELEADAELWLERGSTVTFQGDKITSNYGINLNGTFRVFGEGNNVKIICNKLDGKPGPPDKGAVQAGWYLDLLLWAGRFQHLVDLSFELGAKGRGCRAIAALESRGQHATGWIEHCSINGKDPDLGHVGIFFENDSVAVVSDCELSELAYAYAGVGGFLFSHRNTFTKNRYAQWGYAKLGTKYLYGLEFVGNEDDLHIHEHRRHPDGKFVIRHSNLTSQLYLSEDITHSYDLRFNYWRRGPQRQIFEYQDGGASRANYEDRLKTKIKGIGARKRPTD